MRVGFSACYARMRSVAAYGWSGKEGEGLKGGGGLSRFPDPALTDH